MNMLKLITRIPAHIYFLGAKIRRKILYVILKPMFRSYGRNLQFSPTDSIFTFHTIFLGDDVHIGPGAKFIASISSIKIGSKVMFGPNVTIRGGNHNTSVIGKYMRDVTDKRPEDDLPVIIEDDVWVGTNVTILKGVKIGRGSIIAAGAVVNKDVPRYSIVGGVPAKVIKKRWSEAEIKKHEQLLGIN